MKNCPPIFIVLCKSSVYIYVAFVLFYTYLMQGQCRVDLTTKIDENKVFATPRLEALREILRIGCSPQSIGYPIVKSINVVGSREFHRVFENVSFQIGNLETMARYSHYEKLDKHFLEFLRETRHSCGEDVYILGLNSSFINFQEVVNLQILETLDLLSTRSRVLWLQKSPFLERNDTIDSEDEFGKLLKALGRTHAQVLSIKISESRNERDFLLVVQKLLAEFLQALPYESSGGRELRNLFPRQTYYVFFFIYATSCMLIIACTIKYFLIIPSSFANAAVCLTNTERALSISHPETRRSGKISVKTLIFKLLKCGFIFLYIYICDNTNIFWKDQKFFTPMRFFVPVLATFISAVWFRSSSSSSKIMNREITDEWKGWMQVVILIYHYIGAISDLSIYVNIRVLVGAYIFMTGFGNVCHFYSKGCLSLKRYMQVMFRLNFLVIILCVMMGQNYMNYYFVPLISFFYSLVTFVLVLPPKSKNSATGPLRNNLDIFKCLMVKMVYLFLIITALNEFEGLFNGIFGHPFLKVIFQLPGAGPKEWKKRFSLDRYCIVFGGTFGAVYSYVTDTSNSFVLTKSHKRFLQMFTKQSVPLAVMCIAVPSLLLSICSNATECMAFHPFVSWIPITGYIVLRNSTRKIRSIHSSLMRKMGEISLELFLLQYHIHQAWGVRKTLILIPGLPHFLNTVLVCGIFVFFAQEVHEVTSDLTNFIFS